MLGQLARLALRVTIAGVAIGAATAALGLGAIAISELLSRRGGNRFDDEFLDEVPPAEGGVGAQALDDEFLSLLACPVCKTSVQKDGDWLVCDSCGRRYPIRDGIPVMLVEEAEMGEPTSAKGE
jgi:uncharacterized protein YbaR (Trm112 family)